MTGLQQTIELLTSLAVRTHYGRTECHVCGAFTESIELIHVPGCLYVVEVARLMRIDPVTRMKEAK